MSEEDLVDFEEDVNQEEVKADDKDVKKYEKFYNSISASQCRFCSEI
jgi:hypothetical protein